MGPQVSATAAAEIVGQWPQESSTYQYPPWLSGHNLKRCRWEGLPSRTMKTTCLWGSCPWTPTGDSATFPEAVSSAPLPGLAVLLGISRQHPRVVQSTALQIPPTALPWTARENNQLQLFLISKYEARDTLICQLINQWTIKEMITSLERSDFCRKNGSYL